MNPFSLFVYKIMTWMLTIMAAAGIFAAPVSDEPIDKTNENARLLFAAWGDTQVSNYMYEREGNFIAACQDVKNSNAQLDALIIAGDVAENGMESEYAVVSDGLNSLSEKVDHILIAQGNHDVRLKAYKLQLKRFTQFLNGVDKAVPLDGKYYYRCDIKGYRFLVLGTEKTVFEESYLSDTQLSWLEGQLADAPQGKPAFVICHQPLQNTHGLPGTWNAPELLKAGSIGKQGDKLRQILNKYENAVLITGHLHTGAGQYTVEKIDNFYAVNLPAIGPGNDNGCTEDGQGILFEVYSDRILLRARSFATGKYLPQYSCEIPVKQ